MCPEQNVLAGTIHTRSRHTHTHTRTRTHVIQALHLHLVVSGSITEIKCWVITFTSLFSMVTASDRFLGSASKPCCTCYPAQTETPGLSYMYDLGVTATRRLGHFSAIHAQPTPTQRSRERQNLRMKAKYTLSITQQRSINLQRLSPSPSSLTTGKFITTAYRRYPNFPTSFDGVGNSEPPLQTIVLHSVHRHVHREAAIVFFSNAAHIFAGELSHACDRSLGRCVEI